MGSATSGNWGGGLCSDAAPETFLFNYICSFWCVNDVENLFEQVLNTTTYKL